MPATLMIIIGIFYTVHNYNNTAVQKISKINYLLHDKCGDYIFAGDFCFLVENKCTGVWNWY